MQLSGWICLRLENFSTNTKHLLRKIFFFQNRPNWRRQLKSDISKKVIGFRLLGLLFKGKPASIRPSYREQHGFFYFLFLYTWADKFGVFRFFLSVTHLDLYIWDFSRLQHFQESLEYEWVRDWGQCAYRRQNKWVNIKKQCYFSYKAVLH